MKLADRSPGLTIALAFVVVYGQILVEIGMWTEPTWLTMFATLGLAITLAVLVCRFLFDLLSEEEPVVETAPAAATAATVAAAEPAAAPAPASPPTQRRAPRATAIPA